MYGGEADADLGGGDIEKLLLGHFGAAETVLRDGHGGGVVLDDERRLNAGRHEAENGLGGGGDLGERGIHGGAGLQKDLHHGNAVVRGGFNVLNVIDGHADDAFMRVGDALLNLGRIQPGVLPDDADDGDVDGGKNVGGRAQQDERREEHEQQGGHHEGVRPAQSELDNPHKIGYAGTRVPGWQ